MPKVSGLIVPNLFHKHHDGGHCFSYTGLQKYVNVIVFSAKSGRIMKLVGLPKSSISKIEKGLTHISFEDASLLMDAMGEKNKIQ